VSVFTEISIGAGEFPVGRALSTGSDTTFELESLVPTQGTLLPFFWAHGGDVDAVVRSVSLPSEIGDAVATALDREYTDLDPLHDIVDPDAHNTLFDRSGRRGVPDSVSFTYHKCNIVVGDGRVLLDRQS